MTDAKLVEASLREVANDLVGSFFEFLGFPGAVVESKFEDVVMPYLRAAFEKGAEHGRDELLKTLVKK